MDVGQWRPEELMARYRKAGARIFVALANHHDGFDCWNSKHHPWNSVSVGPRRDVVGGWAEQARKQGMRSESLCTRRGTGGGSNPRTARMARVRAPAFPMTAN